MSSFRIPGCPEILKGKIVEILLKANLGGGIPSHGSFFRAANGYIGRLLHIFVSKLNELPHLLLSGVTVESLHLQVILFLVLLLISLIPPYILNTMFQERNYLPAWSHMMFGSLVSLISQTFVDLFLSTSIPSDQWGVFVIANGNGKVVLGCTFSSTQNSAV